MPVKDESIMNEYRTSVTNIATEIAMDLAHNGSTITYGGTTMIPDVISTTCTTTSPEYIFYSTTPSMYEEYVNKAVDKIDRHVDKLEEDIDYFNHKLEESDTDYDRMSNTLSDMNVKILELTEKIESMKKEIDFYESLISEDHLAVMELRDKGVIK